MTESALLLEQLAELFPGNGIASDKPDIMEEVRPVVRSLSLPDSSSHPMSAIWAAPAMHGAVVAFFS